MLLLMLFAFIAGAGTTGRTQGVIAVPAPAMKANSISRSICPSDDARRVLRKG